MNESELYSKLCDYDKRSPDYDSENGDKKTPCYCESCFYGRSELANYCIEIRDLVGRIIADHDISIGGIDKRLEPDMLNKLKLVYGKIT